MNSKSSSLKHIIKLFKIKAKKRISKAAREKIFMHGNPCKSISRFLSGDLSAEREWDDMFKMLKETANQEYSIQQTCPSKIKVRYFP